MKIGTIIAICAALAFSMAAAVTKIFQAAIPNIPGKSLIALEAAGRDPFDQP